MRNSQLLLLCSALVYLAVLICTLSLVYLCRQPKTTLKRAIGSQSAAQDLYGIGIRVGFYLQAIAGILNTIRPCRQPSGGMPIIFSTTVFIAILAAWTDQARNNDISAAETIVILSMLWTNMTTVFNSIFTSGIRGNGMGLLLATVVNSWLIGAWLWFWPIGQDQMHMLGTKGKTWFFVSVRIGGWFRWYMTALMCIVALPTIISGISFSITVIGAINWWWSDGSDDEDWTTPKKKIMTTLVTSAITTTMVFPFIVANAEMTIQYNDLEPFGDISTPGQLIPFVAGLTSVIDALLYVSRPPKENDDDDNVQL